MDMSSPLAMQFKQFDTDQDGQLNTEEVHQLLKLLGKNVYKGSIKSAIICLNYRVPQGQNNQLVTFEQFKQYFESLENSLKHSIWKSKYNMLLYINEIRNQMNKSAGEATAAPGAAKPSPNPEVPLTGNVELTVGPTDAPYNSSTRINMEKSPKAESKPFLKIVFEQSSNQRAKQLQTLIKSAQNALFQLLKSNEPDSSQILDFIHIMTNVSENKLNIFVTTSNELLVQLGATAAEFLDLLLGVKIQAKIDLSYDFNVDISNFLSNTSDYSFYNALTENYKFRLNWNAMNFKQSAKQVLKQFGAFEDLQHDKMEPALNLLIAVLHTEICDVNLVFDNADFSNPETETKQQILSVLKDISTGLMQEYQEQVGIFKILDCFDNRLSIQASIGDWKVQARVNVHNLNQIINPSLVSKAQSSSQQQQPQAVNAHSEEGQKILTKQSSKKSIGIVKKSSFQSSQSGKGSICSEQSLEKKQQE